MMNETGYSNSSGPTVGLLSAQIPRELPFALGCTPVRIFPTADKPTAAESFLPGNFCALSRLILASFLEQGTPPLDAVIFADEDDAMRRLHDVWRVSVSVPVWSFVEVPRASTALAIDRYTEILTHLVTVLEAHTRRSLDASTLREAISLYNEQRCLLADVKHKWLSGDIHTLTYRRLRRTTLTQDPRVANEALQQALEETYGSEKDLALSASSHRLIVLAELAAPASLVRLVEAHGAKIVAEDSDLDERDLTEPVPCSAGTVEGLLGALAQAYLAKPHGPRMRDMPRRLAFLAELITQRDIHAAICAYSKFCDLFLAEFPTLKAHLASLGVPVLLLELEDEAISGQHRTRVEAFLEMLNKG
jgi:benzoyl-CoA reductase/2-hydroxyglutaryl-CoA dehydratase subunit BcrC/BadD/HgdB